MMGELTFILRLQVHQRSERIFISQAKYVRGLLKKFDMVECSPAKTPMSTFVKLDVDKKGISINITTYRCMIDYLLYLTASRPDIMFATCLCARFRPMQRNPI